LAISWQIFPEISQLTSLPLMHYWLASPTKNVAVIYSYLQSVLLQLFTDLLGVEHSSLQLNNILSSPEHLEQLTAVILLFFAPKFP